MLEVVGGPAVVAGAGVVVVVRLGSMLLVGGTVVGCGGLVVVVANSESPPGGSTIAIGGEVLEGDGTIA